MKAQPSSGLIFNARSCLRRDYPSEAMEIVSYCTKSGRVSRKLGIEEIPFHNQVTSGDIDDIQDHRCRMSRRTFFYPQIKIYHRTRYYARRFAWAWMAVCAWSPSPRGLATLNPQSTCHGPRPGPKLARGVRSGSLRATDTRERETTGGRNIKKMPMCQKTHLHISNICADRWNNGSSSTSMGRCEKKIKTCFGLYSSPHQLSMELCFFVACLVKG